MSYTGKEKARAVKDVVWAKIRAFLTAVPWILLLLSPGIITILVCLWLGIPGEETFGLAIVVYMMLFLSATAFVMGAAGLEQFLAKMEKQLIKSRGKENRFLVRIDHGEGAEGPDGWMDAPHETVWARRIDRPSTDKVSIGSYNVYVLEEEPTHSDYSAGDTVWAIGSENTVGGHGHNHMESCLCNYCVSPETF